MPEKVLLSGRKQAYQLLCIGMLGVLLVSIVLLSFHGINAAWSFFIGGFVCFVPALYQVKSIFKESYASAAKRILVRLYITELLKFISVTMAFIVLMHWTHLNVLAFISGFLLVNFGIWMALPILMPILMKMKR